MALKPKYLTILVDAASKQLLDDLAFHDRLCDNSFDVRRCDSAVPDALASQSIRFECWRDVDYDIALNP